MTTDIQVKARVREFYDRVGWRAIGEGLYQNARYEDLRPVSAEYLHHSHLRVGRYLVPEGKFLLDAGSGPIQYPEYLEYSAGFKYRVCLDLSRRALIEARDRLGAGGLYVLGDVARLPFREGASRPWCRCIRSTICPRPSTSRHSAACIAASSQAVGRWWSTAGGRAPG